MARVLLMTFLLVCSLPGRLTAQVGIYQRGTVVRMHMGECMPSRHGLVSTLGGGSGPAAQGACPEYTLVSKDVVFLILGKQSTELMPLAQTIDFRLCKNELAIRVDDAKHEAAFTIKEMMVRSEWDRLQRHMERQMMGSGTDDPER